MRSSNSCPTYVRIWSKADVAFADLCRNQRRDAMNKLLVVGLVACVSCYAQSVTFAQEQTNFKKENFSYNEWTKGKFSEVVTVTNPGKFIFLAGIGPEREGDGKIVHEGNFMEQCRYAYMKIKKLLDM